MFYRDQPCAANHPLTSKLSPHLLALLVALKTFKPKSYSLLLGELSSDGIKSLLDEIKQDLGIHVRAYRWMLAQFEVYLGVSPCLITLRAVVRLWTFARGQISSVWPSIFPPAKKYKNVIEIKITNKAGKFFARKPGLTVYE